ncbi:MarR family winged helix-turn-helix transcriptional regulator [Asticcacaulis sp. AC460]|uniref:MarR family winged helix-turn-helix transcriptional regulator n=1 Tax=Asticcacaulis sp. AC460 TaxID=1282360 RepID=UPI001F3BC110|nr:helix-turn-helix domain-containing protein [Asticcacaulis sp. AC460]
MGALVRHLIECLDGEVEKSYEAQGLAWRPRYTPVLRALMELGPASIKTVALKIGISHSAVSQTVSQMTREGLVELRKGDDGRERILVLTAKTQVMVPELQRHWLAVNAAADQLDAELSAPLSSIVREALAALDARRFGERISAAAASLPSRDRE